MADINITYETLFDLLRRERNRDELQKLDSTFYTDVLAYMAAKQALLPKTDVNSFTAEGEKARIQFHNIKKILKELYDRREKKLVLLAMNTVRTGMHNLDRSAFLPEEHLFFNDLTKTFQGYRRDVLEQVLRQAAPFGGSTPQPISSPKVAEVPESAPAVPKSVPAQKAVVPEKKSVDGTKVTFLKPVPRFAGGNEQVFGPYKTGDVATLPDKIASVLVKKGRAQEA